MEFTFLKQVAGSFFVLIFTNLEESLPSSLSKHNIYNSFPALTILKYRGTSPEWILVFSVETIACSLRIYLIYEI